MQIDALNKLLFPNRSPPAPRTALPVEHDLLLSPQLAEHRRRHSVPRQPVGRQERARKHQRQLLGRHARELGLERERAEEGDDVDERGSVVRREKAERRHHSLRRLVLEHTLVPHPRRHHRHWHAPEQLQQHFAQRLRGQPGRKRAPGVQTLSDFRGLCRRSVVQKQPVRPQTARVRQPLDQPPDLFRKHRALSERVLVHRGPHARARRGPVHRLADRACLACEVLERAAETRRQTYCPDSDRWVRGLDAAVDAEGYDRFERRGSVAEDCSCDGEHVHVS
eukprot:2264166-Rhodomonas_salina.1